MSHTHRAKLTAPQIRALHHIAEHGPQLANCNGPRGCGSGSMRALARKGLLDVRPDEKYGFNHYYMNDAGRKVLAAI